MANTLAEARDVVLGIAQTAWNAAAPGAPIVYDNLDSSTPAIPTTYARASVRWFGGTRASLGGQTHTRRVGFVFVQIFVPHGSGVAALDPLVEAMTRAFEDATLAAAGNVWFRDAGPQDIGSDGVYHQVNVVAQFQYDRTS